MSIISKPSIRQVTALVLAISAAFLMTACGGGSSNESGENESKESETKSTATATATTTATTTAAIATPAASTTVAASSAGSLGKTAWSNNCVSCHGGDTGKGNNASKTMSAIASNKGGMGILSGIVSATDANNIAAYTANPGAY
jgi:mono/diheme cytochrome c family protein